MSSDHPCLVFSRNLVAARLRDNHNKKKVDNYENGKHMIDLCVQRLQLQNAKRLINSIIKTTNN